jgi:hypothetical protein
MHFLVNLLNKKAWFFLGVLTAVAIQAQRLPLPPRVRTAALALGKQKSSPQRSFLAKTHIPVPVLFKRKIKRDQQCLIFDTVIFVTF